MFKVTDKMYLGSLCKRGHNHSGEGHSYRYKSGHCAQCIKYEYSLYRAERESAWRRANSEKCCARVARRYANKTQASPKWANEFFVEEVYDLARLRTKYTGVKHHVDHIIPLHHPLVCGLHTDRNLQVLTAKQNSEKHNSFEIA